MNEQKIPGVRKATLSGISGRTWALGIVAILLVAAAVVVAISRVNMSGPTTEVNADDFTCTYDRSTERMTIVAHLDATAPGAVVTLTAGVRDPHLVPFAEQSQEIQVGGHVEDDYTFVLDLPLDRWRSGVDTCYVNTGIDA